MSRLSQYKRIRVRAGFIVKNVINIYCARSVISMVVTHPSCSLVSTAWSLGPSNRLTNSVHLWVNFRNCTARHEKLEVNPTLSTGMDFSNIVKDKKQSAVGLKQEAVKDIVEENSEDFIDDPDVPPLM